MTTLEPDCSLSDSSAIGKLASGLPVIGPTSVQSVWMICKETAEREAESQLTHIRSNILVDRAKLVFRQGQFSISLESLLWSHPSSEGTI
jgi:hypothetical protein